MKQFLVFLMRQKEGLHLNEARERISSALDCRSILISEGKKNGNYHLVLGVLCVNSSKSTILAKKVHILFNDCHCETRFLKGWGPICTYFSSRGEFQAFGCYSEKQIHAMAQQTRYHKKMGCGSDKNPWEGKNFNTYRKKTRSKWFVIIIKRAALAAVVFQIIGYFFYKNYTLFRRWNSPLFPSPRKSLVSYHQHDRVSGRRGINGRTHPGGVFKGLLWISMRCIVFRLFVN